MALWRQGIYKINLICFVNSSTRPIAQKMRRRTRRVQYTTNLLVFPWESRGFYQVFHLFCRFFRRGERRRDAKGIKERMKSAIERGRTAAKSKRKGTRRRSAARQRVAVPSYQKRGAWHGAGKKAGTAVPPKTRRHHRIVNRFLF